MYRRCPFLESTGRWQQQSVYATIGTARIAAEKRVDARAFALSVKAEHLYAVFGGFAELGGRPYWLLLCKNVPYQAPAGLKAHDGATINQGWWVIDAHWYASTSDNQERRSYKLLGDELVHVPVGSLVQEKDLEFDREGRNDRILGDGSHLQIMRHNFSNVVTYV